MFGESGRAGEKYHKVFASFRIILPSGLRNSSMPFSGRGFTEHDLLNARVSFERRSQLPNERTMLMLRKAVQFLCVTVILVTLASAQATRHLTFHYAFTVKNVPAGEKLRIWIPLAH